MCIWCLFYQVFFEVRVCGSVAFINFGKFMAIFPLFCFFLLLGLQFHMLDQFSSWMLCLFFSFLLQLFFVCLDIFLFTYLKFTNLFLSSFKHIHEPIKEILHLWCHVFCFQHFHMSLILSIFLLQYPICSCLLSPPFLK